MLSRKTIRLVQDKLHRGFVYTCMGVTVVAGIRLGFVAYKFITEGGPAQRHEKLLELTDKEDLSKYTDDFPSSSEVAR